MRQIWCLAWVAFGVMKLNANQPQPCVETLVAVLSHSQVKDIYSKQIAKHYQVATITVLNNCATSILLQTVAFKGKGAQPIVPNGLATVLQDIHRKEEKDFHTQLKEWLQYGSVLLPAPTPFFKNALSRGAFNQSLSIYNSARTSIFDTFPDFYDEVTKLLQSNKLFIQNFKISAKSSDTVDVFIANEQLSLLSPGSKKKPKDVGASEIASELGDVTVYSIDVPSDANVNASAPAPSSAGIVH